MEPPSARAMAIAAASAAVANVAPGQRYRAIEQATKAVGDELSHASRTTIPNNDATYFHS